MSTERPDARPDKDPGCDSLRSSLTAKAGVSAVSKMTRDHAPPRTDGPSVVSLNVIEADTALVSGEDALSSPVVRANLHFVLARAFGPPQRWPDSFSSLIELATGQLSDPFQRAGVGMIAALHETDLEAHLRAHTALFVGPFQVPAPPWASFYLDPEQRIGGPCADPIRDVVAQLGLAPAGGWPEPPDHVAYLFELLYVLAFRSAQGEHHPMVTEASVWETFLQPWLPRFLDLLRAAAAERSHFYASVCDLADSFVAARTDAASRGGRSAKREQAGMS